MSDGPPLPRIAVFAGPTATITNTHLLCFLPGASRFPVIVGSGWDGFLPLPFDGLGGVATSP